VARKIKFWTLREEDFLKENYGEMNAKECAAHLGRSIQSVKKKAQALGLKLPPTMYEVYQGENVVAEGTAQECADKLNCSKKYIFWLATESAHKRIANYISEDKALIAFKR